MLRRGRSKQTFKQAPMIRRRSVLPGRVDVILFLGELPPAARLSGTKLGLRIAAGNVPNLVDLETGGLGPVIQDPLNSSQTTTLATFKTLANLLTGCITRVQGDACDKFFALATPPGGVAPTDTLMAAQNIARNPSNQAQKLFALFEAFYPVPAGKRLRPAPLIP